MEEMNTCRVKFMEQKFEIMTAHQDAINRCDSTWRDQFARQAETHRMQVDCYVQQLHQSTTRSQQP